MRVNKKTENEALMTLLNGVEMLLETVDQSLGPFGRATAIITEDHDFVYTSHGIEIVESFHVTDSLEQIGVRFLREAAQEVNRLAGDATTSAMVVTGSVFVEAVKLITSGHNSISIQAGILKGLEAALNSIKSISRPLQSPDELRAVARTASRGDDRDIDALIEASETAGESGYISVEVNAPGSIEQELTTSVIVKKGIEAPGQIAGFTHDAPMDCPFHVVALEKSAFHRITPSDLVARLSGTTNPILIFTDSLESRQETDSSDAEENALEALLTAAESAGMQLLVNLAPSYEYGTEITLRDVAAFCGTTPIASLRSADLEIGNVDNAVFEDNKLALTGGRPDTPAFQAQTKQLQKAINADHRNADSYRKRLALLLGKYVTITAFEVSEETRKERRTVLNNMRRAVANAQRFGVVAGGGTALAYASSAIAEARPANELERFGFEAVRRALLRPLHCIAKNAGKEPTSVLEGIQQSNFRKVFDVKTGRFCDLAESSIIDPTANILAILRTSISTIRAMLNLSSLISIEETTANEEENLRMGAPGLMSLPGRRVRHRI